MRMLAGLLFGVGLLIGTAGRTAADPGDVIDRAVRAQAGSAAQLQKRKTCVLQSKGTMSFPGAGEVSAVRECTADLPDRLKCVGELTLSGNKVPFTITLNGVKGWRMMFGAAQDMSPPEYDAVQDEAYFMWVSSLIPLQEKKLALTELPEAVINGRPAAVVQVASKARGQIQLYFDKATSLLVKGAYRSREAGLDVAKEQVFADYREFGGLKLPAHVSVFQNGKKVEDWTDVSYRFVGKVEEKVFAKP
jgi:hypothetical protein